MFIVYAPGIFVFHFSVSNDYFSGVATHFSSLAHAKFLDSDWNRAAGGGSWPSWLRPLPPLPARLQSSGE